MVVGPEKYAGETAQHGPKGRARLFIRLFRPWGNKAAPIILLEATQSSFLTNCSKFKFYQNRILEASLRGHWPPQSERSYPNDCLTCTMLLVSYKLLEDLSRQEDSLTIPSFYHT